MFKQDLKFVKQDLKRNKHKAGLQTEMSLQTCFVQLLVCFMQVDNIGFLHIDIGDEAGVKADFNELVDYALAKLQK